jgi:hypothetical protein
MVWDLTMKDENIQRGLKAMGFSEEKKAEKPPADTAAK